MGGRVGFPLYTIYNSTKWAVEGFSEALYYELKALNIKVKIIEPGVIKTDFYDRSMATADCTGILQDYGPYLSKTMGPEASQKLMSSTPEMVARVIFKAANDSGWRLRYIAGNDAWQIMLLRTLAPESWFKALVEKFTSK
jgi:short-subunit dehydrogenase